MEVLSNDPGYVGYTISVAVIKYVKFMGNAAANTVNIAMY